MNLRLETEAVRVENLSVSYSVVAESSPAQKRKFYEKTTRKTKIKALDDISFSIPSGKIVGLIGGNGAGKSTLLKTVIGVLKPATGKIDLWGRPHLLSPGMGFNRLLSGRENVVLGGLAAGMTLNEVKEKQESIIEFADIGGFIDLPMTTYSSGMFGRLSFAVATHIRPEILLIDEALSAGDAAFKERAVQRLKDLCESALSIVVVSHSSTLVAEMATEAIWLHRGKIKMQGEVQSVTDEYLKFQAEGNETAQLDQR
tara:strand:+ start:904 stop:1674 length:771 start_codon:yes stop_codon:yes gene_type:complete